MNWIYALNTMACIALLVYMLPAAAAVRKWRHRGALCVMVWAVVLQMMSPVLEWIPGVAWPTAFFNTALVVFVTFWRKPLWHLIEAKFNPSDTPRRRRTDRRQPA